MKLFLFVVTAILLTGSLPVQDYGPLRVNWNDHYRARPDYSSAYYALTALTFRYSYESRISGKQLQLSFRFFADVDRTKSWVKREKLQSTAISNALLLHEQGHVNINYLMMRETEKRLKANKYNVKTFKKEIEDTARDVYIYYDEMQKKYDQETVHGTAKRAQQKWTQFIDQSLIDLKD